MNAVNAALREANNKEHDGAAYQLGVRFVNGEQAVGGVVEADETHVVLVGENGTIYVNSAHVMYAQIAWLP